MPKTAENGLAEAADNALNAEVAEYAEVFQGNLCDLCALRVCTHLRTLRRPAGLPRANGGRFCRPGRPDLEKPRKAGQRSAISVYLRLQEVEP